MRPLHYPYARANRRPARAEARARIITSLVITAAVSTVLPLIDVATNGIVARGVTAALAWAWG